MSEQKNNSLLTIQNNPGYEQSLRKGAACIRQRQKAARRLRRRKVLKCGFYGSITASLSGRDALLFENCLSHAPNTWSSFASILTGFLPHETKVLQYVPFPEGFKTLPESLKEQGYKTIAVVSNYVMHKGQGYEQGFMIYDDTMEERELVRASYVERIAKNATNRAIELLRQCQREQFFI